MRFSLALLLALSMAVLMPGPASADGRVALVVGNGAYKNAARVPNAPLSAKAMAALLKEAGFDVVQAGDLTRDEMERQLLAFSTRAREAELAVFYYSGIALTLNDRQYLVPIDANIKSAMDVRLGAAINLDIMIDRAMAGAKVRLVFLDASRDDSLASKSAGAPAVLAPMSSTPEDTLIGYATGPGQSAPDGPEGNVRPFTRALIANIAAPGVEIQQAMVRVRAQVNEESNRSQLPWGFSNLLGAVYLRPRAAR